MWLKRRVQREEDYIRCTKQEIAVIDAELFKLGEQIGKLIIIVPHVDENS